MLFKSSFFAAYFFFTSGVILAGLAINANTFPEGSEEDSSLLFSFLVLLSEALLTFDLFVFVHNLRRVTDAQTSNLMIFIFLSIAMALAGRAKTVEDIFSEDYRDITFYISIVLSFLSGVLSASVIMDIAEKIKAYENS